jgi:hypothetical protein
MAAVRHALCPDPVAALVVALVKVTHRFEIPDIGTAGICCAEHDRLWPCPERRVALVGLAAAAAWVASPWLRTLPGFGGLSDMGIAMLAAPRLYLVPAGGGQAGQLLTAGLPAVPWDTLFLFGGGSRSRP